MRQKLTLSFFDDTGKRFLSSCYKFEADASVNQE